MPDEPKPTPATDYVHFEDCGCERCNPPAPAEEQNARHVCILPQIKPNDDGALWTCPECGKVWRYCDSRTWWNEPSRKQETGSAQENARIELAAQYSTWCSTHKKYPSWSDKISWWLEKAASLQARVRELEQQLKERSNKEE